MACSNQYYCPTEWRTQYSSIGTVVCANGSWFKKQNYESGPQSWQYLGPADGIHIPRSRSLLNNKLVLEALVFISQLLTVDVDMIVFEFLGVVKNAPWIEIHVYDSNTFSYDNGKKKQRVYCGGAIVPTVWSLSWTELGSSTLKLAPDASPNKVSFGFCGSYDPILEIDVVVHWAPITTPLKNRMMQHGTATMKNHEYVAVPKTKDRTPPPPIVDADRENDQCSGGCHPLAHQTTCPLNAEKQKIKQQYRIQREQATLYDSIHRTNYEIEWSKEHSKFDSLTTKPSSSLVFDTACVNSGHIYLHDLTIHL